MAQRTLDMTRGRPPGEVLDAMAGLEQAHGSLELDGVDLRNYGAPLGLPSCRALGASLLSAPPDATMVGANSSMILLHQVATAALHAGWGAQRPWRERRAAPKVVFPVPGYDRHAKLLDILGVEMLPVPMEDDGMAEQGFHLLESDPDVVGVVLVPRHSNPGGEIWRREKLRRVFAAAASRGDLLALCDHAYAIHDLSPEAPPPFSIYDLARESGALESLALLGSTSKLGYAGSGLSFLACAPEALKRFAGTLGGFTLGADKLAQARHLRFFGDGDGLRRKFAELAAPALRHRFALVQEHLEGLCDIGDFRLSRPLGGYFHSLWVPRGCAAKTVELAAARGLVMTPAGAAFPGGADPDDSHLRIASTSPVLRDLPEALQSLKQAAAQAAAA